MASMIYCVEDEMNIRELIIYALKSAGFDAKGFETAEDAFCELEKEEPDLILLDIMLPGEDGISILKKLKGNRKRSHIPVILLTAKTSEYDKVTGLDLGADDYITKPFGVMELISRVKAVLRRSVNKMTTLNVLDFGEVVVDESGHSVTVEGDEVILTYKEFELLVHLLKNKGIVLTRDRLLNLIWGYAYEGECRTVDVHIASLRHKLGNYGYIIETIRGVGYKIGGKSEQFEK